MGSTSRTAGGMRAGNLKERHGRRWPAAKAAMAPDEKSSVPGNRAFLISRLGGARARGNGNRPEAGYGGVGRVLFRAFEIRRHGAQRFGRKNFPQGLKPNDYLAVFGTAEAVPFQRGGSRRAVEAALVRGLGEYAALNRI